MTGAGNTGKRQSNGGVGLVPRQAGLGPACTQDDQKKRTPCSPDASTVASKWLSYANLQPFHRVQYLSLFAVCYRLMFYKSSLPLLQNPSTILVHLLDLDCAFRQSEGNTKPRLAFQPSFNKRYLEWNSY